MKILDDIFIVGGGDFGIGLTNPLDCNVYLIDGKEEAVLIDSGVGDETGRIIEKIKDTDIPLEKITKLFLTHAHLDHSGGTAYLKEKLGLKIFISEIDSVYLENGDEESIGLKTAKESGVYPESYKLTPTKVDKVLKNRDIVQIGKYTIQAFDTPGHSKGSLCYYLLGHEKKVLFTGDTLFLRGKLSLLNLPDSSLQDYKIGIKNITSLEVDSLIPSHYGFTVNNGDVHIKLASEALSKMEIPPLI